MRRGPMPNPDLPGLAAMKRAAQPGECICCGERAVPLSTCPVAVAQRVRRGVTRTHRDTCGDDVCRVAWFRFWRRDARAPRHHLVASWRVAA